MVRSPSATSRRQDRIRTPLLGHGVSAARSTRSRGDCEIGVGARRGMEITEAVEEIALVIRGLDRDTRPRNATLPLRAGGNAQTVLAENRAEETVSGSHGDTVTAPLLRFIQCDVQLRQQVLRSVGFEIGP
jgi:hypothetical protein